jgi:hypothetical protein
LKHQSVNTEPLGPNPLNRWLARRREAVFQEQKLVEIAQETGNEVTNHAGATAVGDPRKLRGLPAIGYGVGGAMAGSQPERALMRKEGTS